MPNKPDVTITAGLDATAAVAGADKLEKKIEGVGQTVAKAEHDAAGSDPTDMMGLGKKSVKTSADIERLTSALAMLGSGQMNPHEFILVFRDVAKTSLDAGAAAAKAGGAFAGLAGPLAAAGGMVGPIAIALAAGAALITLWKSFHSEVESTGKKINELEKATVELGKQIKANEVAQRDLNDAMLPADQQKLVKALRDAQQNALRDLAGQGGELDPALKELLAGRARPGVRKKFTESEEGKAEGGAAGLDKTIADIQEKMEKIAKEISQGGAKAAIDIDKKVLEGYAQKLKPLLEIREKMEQEVQAEAAKALQIALTDARATRELYEGLGDEEKKLIDARTADIQQRQAAAKAREEELEAEKKAGEAESERKKKEAAEDEQRGKEWADAMGHGLEYIDAALEKGSETIGEAAASAVKQMVEDGMIPVEHAMAAELDLLDRFDKKLTDAHPFEALPGLTQSLKDEIAIRQKAIEIEKQLLGSHQAIAGQAQGMAGGGSGGGGVAGGAAGAGGGGVAAGAAGPPRGFNAILDDLRKKKLEEVGGPLRPDEQKGLRDTAKFMADKHVQEQRDAMDEKHQAEWEKIKGEAGPGGVDPRKRDQFQRRISKETRGMEQDMARERKQDAQQGDGSKDVKQSMQDANQNAQQLQQGQAEFVGEVAATFQSIAAAFQNLNTINAGGTTAVRSSRQSLPGSGTRR